jgi:glycosyltransferase involved in cell wall biosynthesis
LQTIEPDMDVLDAYKDGRVNILMVGRLSPNKGHAALLKAFATYSYHYNGNSRLLIVGKDEFEAYSAPLRRAVSHLALEDDVVFAGAVTDEALKAYYMAAHVFMITSEHEGFCVPLVEAMAMKIPIVARSSSAIPLTVGDAGLVWEEDDAFLLAESVDYLVRDEALRAALSLKGWQRYEQNFTNERIEKDFLEALRQIL